MKKILLLVVLVVVGGFSSFLVYRELTRVRISTCDAITIHEIAARIIENSSGEYDVIEDTGFKRFSVSKQKFEDFSKGYLNKYVYVLYFQLCNEIDSLTVFVPKKEDFFIFEAPIFEDWNIDRARNQIVVYAPFEDRHGGDPRADNSYTGDSDERDHIVVERIPFEYEVVEKGDQYKAISEYFEQNYDPIFAFPTYTYLANPSSLGLVPSYNFVSVEVSVGGGKKAKSYFYFKDDYIYRLSFVPGKWDSNKDTEVVFDMFMGGLEFKK